MDRIGLLRMEGEGGVIKVYSKRTSALVFAARLTGMNLYECDFKPKNEVLVQKKFQNRLRGHRG